MGVADANPSRSGRVGHHMTPVATLSPRSLRLLLICERQ